jgi:hypothetical protein
VSADAVPDAAVAPPDDGAPTDDGALPDDSVPTPETSSPDTGPPIEDAIADEPSARADAIDDVTVEAEASSNIVGVDFSDPSQTVRNGNAKLVGSTLQLTAATNYQIGSAYLPNAYAIGPNTTFSIVFTFRISDGPDVGVGGDGMTMIWQNAPAGTAALGTAGSGLGYEPNVAPSVDVRLRTARSTAEDSTDNYVAINQGGSNAITAANFALPFDLNDGASHGLWVEYSGASKTITVYLGDTTTKPVTPTLVAAADLEALVGTQAYLGFTASTGGAVNVHTIESMTVKYQF